MMYFLFTTAFALQLLEPFLTQSCTRGSFFSLQIDDHFDDLILFSSVVTPAFLSISPRSITSSSISLIHNDYPIKISKLAYYENVLIVLESQGLMVFDLLNIWEPVLMQHYFNKDLNKYLFMAAGEILVLYNEKEVCLISFYDSIYPKVIAEYNISESIQILGLLGKNVVIGTKNGIFGYKIIDEDLGIVEAQQFISPNNFSLTKLEFSGIYINENIFVMEKNLGLLKLSPSMKVLNKFEVFGEKIAGYKQFLVIDGKYEVNLINFGIITYNSTNSCNYLGIDDQFVYCVNSDKVFYISRLIPLTSEFVFGNIRDFKVSDSLMFVALIDRVKVYSAFLGPVFISGQAPDVVNDYRVEFFVGTNDKNLTEKFILKVQYSLANVITFILLSFIGVFGLVFITSIGCKYCIGTKIETQPIITSTQVIQNTDRNIQSDRGLITGRVNAE